MTNTTTTPTLLPGSTVRDNTGGTYEYGGPNDDPRFLSISYGAGRPVIHCEASAVIPVGAAPSDAELDRIGKFDPRVNVANDKAGRPGSWVGPWRSQVPGQAFPSWHRTKREAVAEAAWRLVIADYWTGQGAAA